LKKILLLSAILILGSCQPEKKEQAPFPVTNATAKSNITHATGFSMEKGTSDITIIRVKTPWPDAEKNFTYALIPREKLAFITLNKDDYDAIIAVPIKRMIATSTTHIPSLEALGEEDKLVGFPGLDYISSESTRKRIQQNGIQELGGNESLNTELVLSLNPDVIIGFGIAHQNKAYQTIQQANIPVVYNGDWAEATPLGKAEWIKFFGAFFGKQKQADSIFSTIKDNYNAAKSLAKKAKNKPSVLSGALFKDVWYLPGGKSWAAQFIQDANANYLWKNDTATGSLSLSLERVLHTGAKADFWIAPSQFTSHKQMLEANSHYGQFNAFTARKCYTFAATKGETGGLLYYELGPNRPDLVLKDLIHIFHPELLPHYDPFFFRPLTE